MDGVLGVLKEFIQHADERFNKVEFKLLELQDGIKDARTDIKRLQESYHIALSYLDRLEKETQINEDERAVRSMQLTRLHAWVEKAGKRIGLEFAR